MANADEDVDRLYQIPLAEFTAARDALAKGAGPRGAAIRKLAKPSAAAWAVNQLYWHHRKTFDRVVAAAERLRAAHSKRLTGKQIDLADVESAHQAAVRAAAEQARQILQNAGDAASAATLNAVTETLQALPAPEPAGRLVRPLKPLGFEALAGLVGGGTLKHAARVLSFDGATPPKARDTSSPRRQADADKQLAEAKKREAARLQQELRAARTAEEQAAAALERIRKALDRAERERHELEEQLDRAMQNVQRVRNDLSAAERQAADSTRQRERAERLIESRKE